MSGVHPYLQRHSQRTRLLWLIVAVCVVGAALLVWSRPAGAHKAELSVRTSCQVDGRWTAAWELTNSEPRKLMDIEWEDVTDLAPNPTPYSGTSTDSTSHANTVASVTAHVSVDWVQHPGASVSATAERPEACEVPTTTVPPTTTATDPVVLTPPPVIEPTRPAVPAVAEPDFTG